MPAVVHEAKSAARQVEDSKPVAVLARCGFAARGLVYIVIGLLALQVAVQGRGKADRNGALAAIKDKPFGGTLLVVLAIAFAGYACWRLLEGIVGHRDEDAGMGRTAKRLSSLARAVLYSFFTVSTLRFLASGPAKDKTKPFTARALAAPGGQVLVALLGLAIIGGGLYAVYRGVRSKFLKHLELGTASSTTKKVVKRLGVAGLVGRGLVLCLIGGFLFEAAVTFDPNKAKGLDAVLKTLAAEPYGQFLLLGAVICLLAFGTWSFVEARYRKV